MTSRIEAIPRIKKERLRPIVVAGGLAVFALAAVGAVHGAVEMGTVLGNMAHGHDLLSSFGNYMTIAHPAHWGTVENFGITNKSGTTTVFALHPIPGADSQSDNVILNPNGHGFIDIVKYHIPTMPTDTVFTPFTPEDNASMLVDATVAVAGGGYGISKGANFLSKRRAV